MTATVVRKLLVTRMTGSTPKAVLCCVDWIVVVICALALVAESATAIAAAANVFIATSLS